MNNNLQQQHQEQQDTTSLDDLPYNNSMNNEPVQLVIKDNNEKVDNLYEKLQNERNEMDNIQQTNQINQQQIQQIQQMEQFQTQSQFAQQQSQLASQQGQGQGQVMISQEQLDEYFKTLQEASSKGALKMPSRDVSMDTQRILQDEESRTNYIPNKNKEDYIGNTETADEIIKNNIKNKKKQDSMEAIYEEIQIPLLIASLFFIFMMPNVRKVIFNIFPSMLKEDGNPLLSGYLLLAFLFGVSYFLINKLLHYLSHM